MRPLAIIDALRGTLSVGRLAVAALAAGAFGAVPARAQTPPPPLPTDIPAIYQYREAVPTGAGSIASGTQTRALPPQVSARLRSEGGSDAATLGQVASSPAYGAPADTPGGTPEPRRRRESPVGDRSSAAEQSPSMLDAFFTAVGGADARMFGLAAVLTGFVVAATAAAARRRHGSA